MRISISVLAAIAMSSLIIYKAQAATQQDEVIKQLLEHIKTQDQQIKALTQRINQIEKKVTPSVTHKKSLNKIPEKILPEAQLQTSITPKTNLNNTNDRHAKRYAHIASPAALLKTRAQTEKSNAVPDNQTDLYLGSTLGGTYSQTQTFSNTISRNFNFNNASISLAGFYAPWLAGVIKLNYDASAPKNDDMATDETVTRIDNSKILLNTAFFTIGNLNRLPLYLSMGQMSVPFADSGSMTLAPALTARLGQVRQRIVMLGYQLPEETGFKGAFYTFNGDSKISGSDANGGAMLGYNLVQPAFKLETSLSYLANIADTTGMQNTRSPLLFEGDFIFDEDDDLAGIVISQTTFGGFGRNNASERLVHRVAGISGMTKMTLNHQLTIQAEYISAIVPFSQQNLTFNGRGAQPSALNIESGYIFKLLGFEHTFALGYNRSFEALALNIPEYSYAAGLKTKVLPNLMVGIGYRRDINYGFGNTATGQTLKVPAANELGKTANTVMGQMSVTF